MIPTGWVNKALLMPRPFKRIIALGGDSAFCVLSVALAFYLRLGDWQLVDSAMIMPAIVSVAIALPIFVTLGLYREIFRYVGWSAIMTIAQAVVFYAVPFMTIYTIFGFSGVPRTVGIIQPLILFLIIAISRTMGRAVLGESKAHVRRRGAVPRVLIYGAGSSGRQLSSAIRASNEMHIIGFIDDSAELWRATIDGVPVFGPKSIEAIVDLHNVTDILLAIPSASRGRRNEIVKQMRLLNLHVRTLPGLLDMARGHVSVADLRTVDVEDLLGRPQVPANHALVAGSIADKVVVVTGAGGSIGSELCRQIARCRPAQLLLIDSCEFNLYAIHHELAGAASATGLGEAALVPLLASVVDPRRMDEIFATWQPDVVFHAAAYKHVPMVEHNIVEGVRNNAIGTLTVARAALQHGTANFVLISTDKAVRPTNIMGASKRLSELVLQALNAAHGTTCFSMVRFGNVLGSSGSVVPLFRRQVAEGGPVTITHQEMTRYFMTIPEAAQLVLHAGAMAAGGEVFVLDMGEPVQILQLARNIIELSGLTVREPQNPDGDIEIRVVGLRPGEKLYEELLIGDSPQATSHPRILQANERFEPWNGLAPVLDEMMAAIDRGDALRTQAILRKVVPEYRPNSAMVDLVVDAQKAVTGHIAAE